MCTKCNRVVIDFSEPEPEFEKEEIACPVCLDTWGDKEEARKCCLDMDFECPHCATDYETEKEANECCFECPKCGDICDTKEEATKCCEDEAS